MSKWKKVFTVNDVTSTETRTDRQKSANFNKLMKTTPDRDIKELKEHSEELAKAQKIEDEKLLEAFANKKVKSKAAIKRALELVKKTNDAGKKTDKEANPQVEVITEA